MVVYDVGKLRHRYVMSTAFKLDVVSVLLDVVSVLPTDVVFFVTYESHAVVARLNRVLRIHDLTTTAANTAIFQPFPDESRCSGYHSASFILIPEEDL